MAKLLFLSHRIPYPPNKGDKIRAHHFFEHLALRHEIWLGTFAENAEDYAEVGRARDLAREAWIVDRSKLTIGAGIARAAVTGASLSVGAFSSATLRHWTTQTIARERPDLVFAFSSAMAQYVIDLPRETKFVMDFVDVDSEKFRQYAEVHSGPRSMLYGHEARRLLAFDRKVAAKAHASLFVSEAERRLFEERCPEAAQRLHVVPNGVDSTYFDPAFCGGRALDGQTTIVFAGRMDYPPNIDAATWFAHEIFPAVRAAVPDARFVIVGADPTPSVRALADLPAVRVTGTVPDMRPFYCEASVIVAPLRIARGVQNKVLEGMAMAKPLVVTPAALEGVSAQDRDQVLVADDPDAFARAVVTACKKEGYAGALGPRARAHILAQHTWPPHLEKLDAIIQQVLNS